MYPIEKKIYTNGVYFLKHVICSAIFVTSYMEVMIQTCFYDLQAPFYITVKSESFAFMDTFENLFFFKLCILLEKL